MPEAPRATHVTLQVSGDRLCPLHIIHSVLLTIIFKRVAAKLSQQLCNNNKETFLADGCVAQEVFFSPSHKGDL